MKIYVLTREINLYDQDGEYYVKSFRKKPSADELSKLLQCSLEYATHILKKGGRTEELEETWYFLREEAI